LIASNCFAIFFDAVGGPGEGVFGFEGICLCQGIPCIPPIRKE
jgi:hypothetical protein